MPTGRQASWQVGRFYPSSTAGPPPRLLGSRLMEAPKFNREIPTKHPELADLIGRPRPGNRMAVRAESAIRSHADLRKVTPCDRLRSGVCVVNQEGATG